MTYCKKLHPRQKSENTSKSIALRLTVERSCDPVEYCTPQIDPAHKVQVIGRVGPAFKDSEDRLVQNSNRTFENVSPRPEYVRAGINRPVTPAIHKGWAPMMEKIKDAINEERRTSDTPYCCVDSIKCKENAMPGSTLTTWWSTRWSEPGPRSDRGGHQSRKKETSQMTITI